MSVEMFDMPDDWEVISLGEVNTLKSRTLVPGSFPDEEFEYYSIPDYQNGQKPSITEGKTIASAKLQLKPRSVLFGKLNPRVEKVWRVGPVAERRQIGSTEWIPILPDERMDADFLYFMEWSDHVMPKAKKLVSGSTPSRQRVDPSSFYKIRVPLPPIHEQQRIAQVLSTVQRAIEQQERLIRTTTELKQALMQKLFTEGLRAEVQKETEIGLVPESWEVVRIKDTGAVVTGSTPSTARADFYGGDYDLVSPGDLDRGKYVGAVQKKLTALGFDQCRKLPKGAVLVGCIGNIGKLGIVSNDRSATNQQINAIVPNDRFNGEFLYYAIDHHRARLESMAGKVTIPLINKSNFERFQIAAANRDDQDIIASSLDAVDKRIAVAEKKRDTLQDLFRTLLHELMTGKVRVGETSLANA